MVQSVWGGCKLDPKFAVQWNTLLVRLDSGYSWTVPPSNHGGTTDAIHTNRFVHHT